MPSMTFRGATLRYFDCRLQEGGAFTRIHASADFSDTIRESMGWPAISDEIQSCKLSGKLAGEHFVLTPNDKALSQYQFQLPVGEVTDFEVVHVAEEGKESTRTEVRFKMRTSSNEAAARLYEYISKVGKTGASLKLKYSAQAELEEQPEEPEVNEEQPPLDNVLNMAGSGRQRKQRTRGDMSAVVVQEDASLQ